MKYNSISEKTLQHLVDAFYLKVRADEDLAPLFERAIGVSDEEWEPHLQRMYAFWAAVMLKKPGFDGNPMRAHRELPAFDLVLFDRWLDLFAATAHEIFEDELARSFESVSQRIAESLRLGIAFGRA